MITIEMSRCFAISSEFSSILIFTFQDPIIDSPFQLSYNHFLVYWLREVGLIYDGIFFHFHHLSTKHCINKTGIRVELHVLFIVSVSFVFSSTVV